MSFWVSSVIAMLSHALLSLSVQGDSYSMFIPPSWSLACVVDQPLQTARESTNLPLSQSPPPGLRATTRSIIVNVTCYVPNSDSFHWKFMDLREWQQLTNINRNSKPANNRTVLYKITVQCSNGANISLPWPMKTEGVMEVHVDNCALTDQNLLYQDRMVSEVVDELRIIEIRNCIEIVDMTTQDEILQNSPGDYINISSSFDCGQSSSLEAYIRSNRTYMSAKDFRIFRDNNSIVNNHSDVSTLDGGNKLSDQFVKPEDRLVTDSESLISDHNGIRSLEKDGTSENSTSIITQDFFEILNKIFNTPVQCSFPKLTILDESGTSDSYKYPMEFLTNGYKYPVLEILNYSMMGITELSTNIYQWQMRIPRIRYVDLSYNKISQVMGSKFINSPSSNTAIFNVRYNNITTFNLDVLNSWSAVASTHIDARNNPIHCNCDMKSLIPVLKKQSSFTGRLKAYEYVKTLKCHSPAHLQGRELRSLYVSSLSCTSSNSPMGWIIVLATVLSVFILTTMVLFRFRAEIRILLYTRLSIRLPWDVASHSHAGKMYDAFVSYSNEDAKWVYHNIAAILERPEPSDVVKKKSQNSLEPTVNGLSSNRNNNNNNNGPSVKGQFKLCLHQRDFIAGMTIMDNIMQCIEASRHTIIVLSPSFMRSHWAMEELRQAYKQSLVEKMRHLIVVLLENIPDAEMDPLIKRCCKTFTYLEVRDRIFKDRLVFSLTTKDRGAKRRDRHTSAQSKRREEDIEQDCYDNQTYDVVEFDERPSPPSRELSNMSCTSTTELTP